MNDLIILAGGKGTRIKAKLKNSSKPMVKIGDRNFLDYLLMNVSKFQFEKIFIIAGHKGHQIKKKYDGKIYNLALVKVIVEEKLKGTAGSLFEIKNKIKNNFFIINGDTIFNINLLKLPELVKSKSICSMALVKNNNYISNSKLINLNLDKRFNVVSTYKKTRLMNGGVYFFKKNFLKLIKNQKASLENDILPKLIKKKMITGKIFKEYFLDIGTLKNLNTAKQKIPNLFNKPAIFLDRDGVINLDTGHLYQKKKLFFIKKTLKLLKKNKYRNYYFFVITNQSGISKAIYKESEFINFQRYIQSELSKKNIFIDDIRYCPHHPQGKILKFKKICSCRKPKNKMITDILKKWQINKEKSFFIGDKITDYKAAKLSKLKYYNINDI